MFSVCDVPGVSATGNCDRSGRNQTAGQVTRDAGDGIPGRFILGTAASAMMDDGIGVFRKELHAAAAIVGSEARDQGFTTGETTRYARLAGMVTSTWQVRVQCLAVPTQ